MNRFYGYTSELGTDQSGKTRPGHSQKVSLWHPAAMESLGKDCVGYKDQTLQALILKRVHKGSAVCFNT